MQTTESILFGGGVNAPVKARLARSLGRSRSTVCGWAKDAGKIPLKDLRTLVRVRELTDKQIVEIVRGK